ncbi:hypothetical protein HPB48_006734 [Haemaphysalis longicornis]|uniref:HAT C-terminal dimerisation domain-containing protein n=1 Tax=Haemaphysalis longicornis TaxID=44386 RepID=A0A9J6G7C6_HAELO|nr:hypothetical protein HPB48_006734 [Haemaphysalis longicornis]
MPRKSDIYIGSDDELDAGLKEKEKSQGVKITKTKGTKVDSGSIDRATSKEKKRLRKDENVLACVETQRLERAKLSELPKVVLACPGTQVNVERNFSGLKFILSPQRVNFSENTLDNVMVIRANWKEK